MEYFSFGECKHDDYKMTDSSCEKYDADNGCQLPDDMECNSTNCLQLRERKEKEFLLKIKLEEKERERKEKEELFNKIKVAKVKYENITRPMSCYNITNDANIGIEYGCFRMMLKIKNENVYLVDNEGKYKLITDNDNFSYRAEEKTLALIVYIHWKCDDYKCYWFNTRKELEEWVETGVI